MPDFEIKVTGIRVEMDEQIVDKEKVHLAMAQAYLRLAQGAFGSKGEFRESPWPALSTKYAKRVKRREPTLYVSGKLYRSLHAHADARAGRVISDEMAYNWAHQQGTLPAKNNVPRRPFFPFDRAGNPSSLAVSTVLLAAKKAVMK